MGPVAGFDLDLDFEQAGDGIFLSERKIGVVVLRVDSESRLSVREEPLRNVRLWRIPAPIIWADILGVRVPTESGQEEFPIDTSSIDFGLVFDFPRPRVPLTLESPLGGTLFNFMDICSN